MAAASSYGTAKRHVAHQLIAHQQLIMFIISGISAIIIGGGNEHHGSVCALSAWHQ